MKNLFFVCFLLNIAFSGFAQDETNNKRKINEEEIKTSIENHGLKIQKKLKKDDEEFNEAYKECEQLEENHDMVNLSEKSWEYYLHFANKAPLRADDFLLFALVAHNDEAFTLQKEKEKEGTHTLVCGADRQKNEIFWTKKDLFHRHHLNDKERYLVFSVEEYLENVNKLR